ncbi:MAG: hypothetical protein MI749_15330, partial [Desulfovibrionales bacterium]|nr:hypothetical protein [Desulfovibrionales bacterium]
MPTDFIYQPSNPLLRSGSILFVAPADSLENHGQEELREVADFIVDLFTSWVTSPPPGMSAEQRSDFKASLGRILGNSDPVDCLPETMGELMSETHYDPPASPGRALPDNLSLVIYLDPESRHIQPSLDVFRHGDVFGQDRSSVSILGIGIPYLQESMTYGQPLLAGALGRAGLAHEGRLNGAGTEAVNDMVDNISSAMDIPLNRPEAARFSETPWVDRAGLEQEIPFIRLNSTRMDLGRQVPMAITEASELGIPVFSLELDAVGNGLVYYPELVLGPLRSSEYMNPDLDVARRILMARFKDSSLTNMEQVIQGYNTELIRTLGRAGRRYYLHGQDPNLASVSIRRLPRRSIRYNNQVSLLIPYSELGSAKFIRSLSLPLDLARVRAIKARSQALLREMGVSATVGPELEAFAFQLFFNIYQRQVAGGNGAGKVNFTLLSRFSSEDAVYSILSDDEVRFVHDWYSREENRTWLLDQFAAEGLEDTSDLSVGIWLDNVLETTAELRLETGRAPLDASSHNSSYSWVPDDSGRLVEHLSHPSPESRRPIVMRDGRYYGVFEYRRSRSEVLRLARGSSDWISGLRATLVRGLVADVPRADAYTVRAAQFTQSVETLLS